MPEQSPMSALAQPISETDTDPHGHQKNPSGNRIVRERENEFGVFCTLELVLRDSGCLRKESSATLTLEI
jgi:hypothetical protein